MVSERLEQFNSLPLDVASAELIKCCGSSRWAERMAARRPFPDTDSLLRAADAVWWELETTDWLEAFSHHPKIGERRAAHNVSEEARRWSEEEQSTTRLAREETMRELVAANREYERKFGFIFIVCATGKRTEEMLTLLKERINNDTGKELRVAAEEQRRITHLRLRKLLER